MYILISAIRHNYTEFNIHICTCTVRNTIIVLYCSLAAHYTAKFPPSEVRRAAEAVTHPLHMPELPSPTLSLTPGNILHVQVHTLVHGSRVARGPGHEVAVILPRPAAGAGGFGWDHQDHVVCFHEAESTHGIVRVTSGNDGWASVLGSIHKTVPLLSRSGG